MTRTLTSKHKHHNRRHAPQTRHFTPHLGVREKILILEKYKKIKALLFPYSDPSAYNKVHTRAHTHALNLQQHCQMLLIKYRDQNSRSKWVKESLSSLQMQQSISVTPLNSGCSRHKHLAILKTFIHIHHVKVWM